MPFVISGDKCLGNDTFQGGCGGADVLRFIALRAVGSLKAAVLLALGRIDAVVAPVPVAPAFEDGRVHLVGKHDEVGRREAVTHLQEEVAGVLRRFKHFLLLHADTRA